MKITYENPISLTPYKNNSRAHPEAQIAVLMRAITEFGFDQPIVVSKDRTIIKGHGRREAAIRLGLKEVPVVVRDISETDAKFLRVADNEVSSQEWDETALRGELRSIESSGMDLNLVGFTIAERDAMFDVKETVIPHEVEVLVETPKHQCPRCGYKW